MEDAGKGLLCRMSPRRRIAGPSAGDFVSHLTRHVSEPVLWQRSIDQRDRGRAQEPAFIEVGPGAVLHNMMGRAWRRRPLAPASTHRNASIHASTSPPRWRRFVLDPDGTCDS